MNEKNMSDYESQEENENIILNLKESDKLIIKENMKKLKYSFPAKLETIDDKSKNFIKEGGKRTKIKKRKSDYDDYLEKTSSQKTRKRLRSIGNFIILNIF